MEMRPALWRVSFYCRTMECMASFTFDTEKLKRRIGNSSGQSKWPKLLQTLGLGGIIFYAVGPALFPEAALRQPELLPVYTLMMGLGELWKGDKDNDDKSDEETK